MQSPWQKKTSKCREVSNIAKFYEIAFNLAGKIESSFSSTFSSASSQLTALQTKISGLKTDMRGLQEAQRSGKISADEYTASYAKMTAQMEKAQKHQKNLASAMNLQKNVNGVKDSARNGMATAGAAGAALAVPAVAAISFDTEMAYVAKQVDNARDDTGKITEIGLQAKSDILTISRDLMVMPNEVAKAYAMSARFGVKGTENLQKMTEMGIMMGKAFELPAEQVSTDMAKIGNALGYNLDTSEGIARLEALADKINYVDDQTIATGDELIDYMKRTAGVVKGLVPTMTESFNVGLGAGFLAAGEKAEIASRAINVMLTKFAAAPKESKGFQEALEEIGMTAEQLQSGMLKDADSAILDIFQRIQKLDDAARNNVLSELIGKDHIDTISKLTGNYDKFVGAIKLANSEASKGSVRKEFKILSETSARQLEGAQAAIARSMSALGEGLLPGINEKAQGMANLADKISLFAQSNPGLTSAVMTTTGSLILMAGAMSGLTWVFTSIAAPISSFYVWATKVELATRMWTGAQWLWNVSMGAGRILLSAGMMIVYAGWMAICTTATTAWTAAQWLWNVALSANPIGVLIVAIGALVAAGYMLLNNWDLIEAKWNRIKEAFTVGGAQTIDDGLGGSIELPGHATGGIFDSPHLAWFAEAGPEAAIPLDGSARALSLWAQAGSALGVKTGGGKGDIYLTYSPTLYGGNASENERVLRADKDNLEERLRALESQERRLSYG